MVDCLMDWNMPAPSPKAKDSSPPEAGENPGARPQGTQDTSPWLQFPLALLGYAVLAVLSVPNATAAALAPLVPFEGGGAIYRIYWMREVFAGRGDSIWFMPDLLAPFGIPTVMQSAGLLKELLAALVLFPLPPWMANNAIVITTPVTVGLAGFLVARRLLGPDLFLAAFATGWLCAWTGGYAALFVTPWIVSTEFALLFVLALLELRTPGLERKARMAWTMAAGISAGLAYWAYPSHTGVLAIFWLAFVADRAMARDRCGLVGSAAILLAASIIAGPLLARTLVDTGWSHTLLTAPPYTTAGTSGAPLGGMLVPPRESKLLGGVGLAGNYTAYLGWTVLALAVVGLAARSRGTGFLGACALASILASLARPVPFAAGAHLCLGLLAGFGLVAVISRVPSRVTGGLICLGATFLQAAEITPTADIRTLSIEPDPWELRVFVGEDARDTNVLDIPYWPGMHHAMRLGSVHGKGVVWGGGGRSPAQARETLEQAFRFPGIGLHDPEEVPCDRYTGFARALADYNVGFIVLHDYLMDGPESAEYRAWIVNHLESPRTWANQTSVYPPVKVWPPEATRGRVQFGYTIYKVRRVPGAEPLPIEPGAWVRDL